MKKLIYILLSLNIVVNVCFFSSACLQSFKKIDLDSIEEKSLGNFQGSEELPSLLELVNQINLQNEYLELRTSYVEFDGNPTEVEAKIKAKKSSALFQGSTNFYYEYKKQDIVPDTKLEDIIKETNLGYIKTDNNMPNKKELLNSIKKKNMLSARFLTEEDFDIDEGQTDTYAKINAKGITFKGSIELTYSCGTEDLKEKLSDVIKITDLGDYQASEEKPKPDLDWIYKKILEKNPDTTKYLNKQDIKVKNEVNDDGVDIVGTDENYTGTVHITFKIINEEV
ncbi:hypothetical protein [Spiroplasma tabanidicola]|uniref:Lipoprotein n=1 Tax=Spiroplasma tabanidicola TaxID=324079 RepID=A0A6I6CB61_9MOLU|nr:hypothetical protein [Spiroplasma tabanidicola]QGS51408.1 hypothetical protein STABA_v1c00410 [Spiroplasma tabanidicola]